MHKRCAQITQAIDVMAKKRSGKKWKPATNNRGIPVSRNEADRMLKYYVKVKDAGGFLAVSAKFGRSRNTVSKIAKRDNWKETVAKIEKRVQTHVVSKIARTQKKNADLAIQLRNTVLDAFLNKKEKDLEKTVSASDCVRVLQYTDQIGAGGANGDGSIANPQALAKALEIVKQLGGDGLKAVANWIVRNNKSPEAAVNGT